MNNYYELDNMGKFYSCISTKKHQTVFSFSCELIDDVDPKVLLESLKETIKIYPNFYVQLKRGLFWYYLEESMKEVKVYEEKRRICERIYRNEDDILFNVTYYKKRIFFNVSHIISDGLGSLEVFKTLISLYVKNKYKVNIGEISYPSITEKEEDSYLRYFKKEKEIKTKEPKNYRYKGKKYKDSTRFMELHMSSKKLLNEAHKYNTTMTIYLLSLLIYSHLNILTDKELNNTIKVDIPVNLRTFFKSNTNKNFFGLTYVSYKFNSREDTLEDIIPKVKEQLEIKLTNKALMGRVSTMVGIQKWISARIIPLPIKNLGLRVIEYFTRKMSTTSISNVGLVKLDKNVEKYIDSINVFTSTDKYQFTVISVKDNLSIGISSIFKNNEVVKEFIHNLSLIDDLIINANEVDKDEM